MLTFAEKIIEITEEKNTRVCLGIDPRPESHPLTAGERFDDDPAQMAKALIYYFQAIIEATHDLVACYKLQSAFFETLGIPGMIAMAQLIADIKSREIPVILDAKRGDIGSTAEAYAKAYLGDGVFSVDALTVNPYLGIDSIEPFVKQADKQNKGIFVLVKTSNPGSADFQDLKLASGEMLYEHVAESLDALCQTVVDSNGYSPIGVVVGATHPQELVKMRYALPRSIFLVPGYGAQGGGAGDVAAAFRKGSGAIVNSSRGLTYITDGDDFAEQSRLATQQMRDAINSSISFSA